MNIPGKRNAKRIKGARIRAESIAWSMKVVEDGKTNAANEMAHLNMCLHQARSIADDLEMTIEEAQRMMAREKKR